METKDNSKFKRIIKLMAISSLIAIGTFAVASAVWYYVEHYCGHFHPYGYLEYCKKGHLVYYLTTVLIYISSAYILIMIPVSLIVFLKAIRTFSITGKQKKTIISLAITQGIFIILTPFFVYADWSAALYSVILAIILWSVNSCYVSFCVSKE